MCLDCMHPPCSNPRCETCKSCRNAKCKKGLNCDTEPEPLVGAALRVIKNTKLCSACRAADSIQCDECKKIVSKDWTNKSSWKEFLKCFDCLHPPCSNAACTTCKSCREPTCTSAHCKQKPRALKPAELAMFPNKNEYVCRSCRNTTTLVKCSDCKAMVREDWTNKSSWNKDVKCYDCLHPPCSYSACTTCKVCRDPTCKATDCKQKPTALNRTELAVFKDKTKYICQRCLFPSCATCKTEMPKITRQRRWKNEYWMDPAQQRVWTCTDCESRENFRKRKA